MDAAEQRCESLHKPIAEAADVVRCVLWGDHSWRVLHRGWDASGLERHWEDKDAWQPPEDRRMGFDPAGGMELAPEDRRMGQEPVESGGLRPASAFKRERDEWKDRCLKAEQARDELRQEVARLDVYERTVDSLGRGTDGELVKRIEALVRQVANQAVTIRELRERLRVGTIR